MAIHGSNNGRKIRAWQLSPVKNCFQNIACFGRQLAEFNFFLCPEEDARAQPIRLHQFLHEGDLVETGGQKEARECGKRLLA